MRVDTILKAITINALYNLNSIFLMLYYTPTRYSILACKKIIFAIKEHLLCQRMSCFV